MIDTPLQTASPDQSKGINRRGLLKLGVLGGLAGAATLATSGRASEALAESDSKEPVIPVTEHDEFPVKVADDYQRFHQKDTAFNITSPTSGITG